MPTCTPKTLTLRLRKTADLLVLGMVEKQIADDLGISVAAVHDHVKRLHILFKAGNNAALTAKYLEFMGAELI